MTTTELFRSMDTYSANKISEGIKKQVLISENLFSHMKKITFS